MPTAPPPRATGADSVLPDPPRYGRAALSDVLPSVAAGLGVPGFHDVLGLGDIDRAVVLLVDGLGSEQLAAHATVAPVMAGLLADGGAIDAAFPTTTPTGLGSLGTGLPSGGHGLVGAAFRVPETGRVLSPLGWQDDPHPVATQPEPTVLERAVRAGVGVATVAPRMFAESGLTRAALRGGDYRGADSFGERLAEVAAALAAGELPASSAVGRPRRQLVYAYWGDLDRTGHAHGVDSPHWRAELAHVDTLVSRIVEALPPGSALYVTADHGMVDCATRVDVDAHPDLRHGVAVLAGEPRARHAYARRGAADEVLAAWRETLGDRAWVVSREQAVTAGWFGDVEPDYEPRIGNVLAVARDDVALVSPATDALLSSLRGQHGSLTAAEVHVPLLRVRG